MLVNFLCFSGSLVTLGFGIWHFFVPRIYKWYDYMDSKAHELILAVRAVNFFFSLSLVLMGLMCMTFLFVSEETGTEFIILLTAMNIMWFLRIVFQIVYPQGSLKKSLQYVMLITFCITFLLFFISFLLVLK